MNLYEMICKDQDVASCYEQIGLAEQGNEEDAYHNREHVMRVAKRVDEVLSMLGCSMSFIENAKIAAILHDVGCLQGKNDHARYSYEYAQQYFIQYGILLEYHEEVLEAIRIHSNGFESSSTIAMALILSDKLDITKERVAPGGYMLEGMRQMQYIENITVQIQGSKFIVCFEVMPMFDQDELERFYFMKKVYRSIEAFASHMQLLPEIRFLRLET